MNFAQMLFDHGRQLFQQGRFEESVTQLAQALRLSPSSTPIKTHLANACREAGQTEQALRYYDEVLKTEPRNVAVLNNKGISLIRLGRHADAAAALGKAARIDPRVPELHLNLGVALHEQDRLKQAEESYRRALALRPDTPLAQKNLATLLRDRGQVDASIGEFLRLLERHPDYADAHFGLAFSLLLQGDFSAGWPEYEWRWQSSNSPEAMRRFDKPRWEGQDIAGRTVLAYSEQGIGDAIQFVRHVPLMAALGARVILQCPASLTNLLATVEGVAEVVATDREVAGYDYHCALMSLPGVFGTRPDTIPAHIPYLFVPPTAFVSGPDAFPADRRKVGIVWAGSATHINNRRRSCPREAVLPLARLPGIALYSLQKSDGAAAEPWPEGSGVIDLTDRLGDFADTAALIERLDLVLTVDTAVAHLAGALGKPVWVMLPQAPDWRWLLGRDDSPWYPTMRLFRQQAPGDWDGVMARVRAALAEP